MHDKKKNEDGKTSEREALEKHVDAMMNPKFPDEPINEPAAEPKDEPPEEDSPATPPAGEDPPAKSAKTAPQLPPKLRKQIGVADASAKPISIGKLDELTKKISEPEEPEADEAEPEEPAPQPQTGADAQSMDLDDARTAEAVDDIVAHEGDVMLAVSDATAAERNRQFEEPPGKGGRGVFSTIMWTFVILVVIVAVALAVLLITGGNVSSLRKL